MIITKEYPKINNWNTQNNYIITKAKSMLDLIFFGLIPHSCIWNHFGYHYLILAAKNLIQGVLQKPAGMYQIMGRYQKTSNSFFIVFLNVHIYKFMLHKSNIYVS